MSNNKISLLCDALRDEALIVKRSTERLTEAKDDPKIAFVVEKVRFDSISHAMSIVAEISKIVSEEVDDTGKDITTDQETG